MTKKQDQSQPKDGDLDEPVVIPLDPVEALRALLAVEPDPEQTSGDKKNAAGS